MKVNDIYVVHWKELIERKTYLEDKIKNNNVCWIDFYDRNTITQDDSDNIYKKDENLWNSRVENLYNDFFNSCDYYCDNTPKDFDIIFLGSSYSTKILDSVGCESNKPEIKLSD